MSWADVVVGLTVYRSPEPTARKTGAHTRKGQLKFLMSDMKGQKRMVNVLVSEFSDKLTGTDNAEYDAEHEREQVDA